MKVLLMVFCLLVVSQQFSYKNYTYTVTYIDSLISKWGSLNLAASIGVPGYPKYPTKYNVYILTAEISYGLKDAAAVWMNPKQFMDWSDTKFGTTNAEVQKSWRKIYNDNGVKIMISAFITRSPVFQDPNSVCVELAYRVRENNLDGIDLVYEDYFALEQGGAERWLITCTKVIRQVLPSSEGYLLTHAPQTSLFLGYKVSPNGAYQYIHSQVGDLIDWYNVKFYDTLDTTYDTYDLLFVDAKYGDQKGTAVKQIHENAKIPYEKIVVGKPCSLKDTLSGYVTADQLNAWGKKAQEELGWNAGWMTWQYRSDEQDQEGQFINTVVGDLAGPFPEKQKLIISE